MTSTTVPEDARHRLYTQLAEILPKQLADELINHHTTVTYAKGSILFLQGSPADLMFWVLSGLAKAYCPMPDGNHTLVRLCGPGDVLGYVNYIDSDGRRLQAYEAQALTKCTVALFTREHAVKMLEKLDQPTLIHLLEQMNTVWSSVAYRFATFLGLSFRQRLELTLKDLASRFGVQDKRGILLPMKLSHAELAEMIVGSRPMVTRLIGELIAERSLYRDGKRYIVPSAAVKNGTGNGQQSDRASDEANNHANGRVNGSANGRVSHQGAFANRAKIAVARGRAVLMPASGMVAR